MAFLVASVLLLVAPSCGALLSGWGGSAVVRQRCASPVLQDVDTKTAHVPWVETSSGFKYIDEEIGDGEQPQPYAGYKYAVVQLHYTVSLLSSGTTLGTSRGRAPLTMALGKDNVPIWDEALKGMRVGGKRRLVVPPSAVPDTQVDKVPGEDRVLRFDFELLGTLPPRHPLSLIALSFPPGRRFELARTVTTVVYLASFVPYFLPYDLQPSFYHDGTPVEEIQERHEQRANSRYLGGDVTALNDLFPSS